jgi:hypothetical protein
MKISIQRLLVCAAVAMFLCVVDIFAQQSSFPTKEIAAKTVTIEAREKPAKIADTGAFAEVYAAKVEVETELKVLTMDYADETPQVREKKLERDLLEREIRWLEALPSTAHEKMNFALGRLLVKKTQAEAALKNLLQNYADEHPLVKKARTRIEVYNSEVQKLLQ